MTNMHQVVVLHFELVQWKQYIQSTYGTPPGLQNLYNNDSNNYISTNSYRDPDYFGNLQVLYRKVITVPA